MRGNVADGLQRVPRLATLVSRRRACFLVLNVKYRNELPVRTSWAALSASLKLYVTSVATALLRLLDVLLLRASSYI